VKGGFVNMFSFSYFMFCKNIYIIYPKVSFEMCVVKWVKILGKMVKIKGIYVIL
jgi:hypothetical protein